MSPLPSQATIPSPSSTAPTMADGDAIMKGLFDHLLQSVALQAERKIDESVATSHRQGSGRTSGHCRASSRAD